MPLDRGVGIHNGKPVVVCLEGEEIPLSDDEKSLLSLSYKFCVVDDLREEEFEENLEEMII